jgi:hypothetical protein
MTTYELLRRIKVYAPLIEMMAWAQRECTCTEKQTCTNCHITSLYHELDDILREAGKYAL